MAKANLVVRTAVREAVLREVERVGIGAFRRESVVALFADSGVSGSTLYRWVDATLKSGAPGQRLARKITEAAEQRAASADPEAELVDDVAACLPAVPKVESVVTAGAIPLMQQLRQCLDIAQRLIRHAESPDGTIRNARLILNASEYLRKCLETAARLQEAIFDVEEIERFNESILATVREVSPQAAEAILIRLRQVCSEAMAE